MAKEKLPITEADKNLASAIHQLTKQNQEEIEVYLADQEMRENYLASIKTLAEQKFSTANDVLALLKQNDAEQQAEKEKQEFKLMEKKVLENLPEKESTRITAMHAKLRSLHNEYFESSYRHAIMLIYEGKVIIDSDYSVIFQEGHKRLFREGIWLPVTEDGCIHRQERFRSDNEKVINIQVKQLILDKDNPDNKHYHLIQEAQEELEQQNKHIATRDNTFKRILESFPGSRDKKRKTFQYLTGFVGKAILDVNAHADNGRILLRCESDSGMLGAEIIKAPGMSGMLFVARDV